MSARKTHPGIAELAAHLGLEAGGDCVQAIVEFCRHRVSQWLAESGAAPSIQHLQELVRDRLGLTIEEVTSDEDLQQTVNRYISAGEPVFASLPTLFDDATYATLIRRRGDSEAKRERFVAVVDCRGPKGHRRFFTRWHEIAHLLTLDVPTATHPVHRSTSRLSAVERLMDMIAAEIGFFEPLFAPVVQAELAGTEQLSFGSIDRIRERFTPEASFQATAFAVVRRWDRPAVYLEAGLGLTSAEGRAFESEPLPANRPTPKLRILKVVGNDAWQSTGIRLARNMEVPADSILYHTFFAQEGVRSGSKLEQAEDLAAWRRSSGRCLSPCKVCVEARPGRHYVQALVQLG